MIYIKLVFWYINLFFQIDFFGKRPTLLKQCKQILEIWAEEDHESSIDNLKKMLEELNSTEGLELLKK